MERDDDGGFLWVANHPCLDSVNTEAMLQGQRTDLLIDPGRLAAWLERAGILTAERVGVLAARWRACPDEGHAALLRARDFRSSLRRMAEELAETGAASEASLSAVNEVLARRVGC